MSVRACRGSGPALSDTHHAPQHFFRPDANPELPLWAQQETLTGVLQQLGCPANTHGRGWVTKGEGKRDGTI